jgi:3-oxoacyl-[acyl-carrier-protein] synthase-1
VSPHAARGPFIEGAGAVCAIGRGLRQVYASVRAGLGGQRTSAVHDRHLEPVIMALFPEEALEPLAAAVDARGWPARLVRMLRLAAPALREAAAAAPAAARPLPLFVGLPESRPGGAPARSDAEIVKALAEQSGLILDQAASKIFARGRAAALLALQAGLRCLAERRAESVLIGGVDSFLDLALLAELDLERRILGGRVMDGFIPGEGAAFLLLGTGRGSAASQAPCAVAVRGVGTAEDPGHRYADQPARGEGLAGAIDKLLAALPRPPEPVGSIFAGFNGESFGAKEWGVARVRHNRLFAPAARIEHPADCYGDTGAATGALLLALAYTALARADRAGPALVFASSDRADRACALLDVVS